MAEMH
jgi:hypothetical protein